MQKNLEIVEYSMFKLIKQNRKYKIKNRISYVQINKIKNKFNKESKCSVVI